LVALVGFMRFSLTENRTRGCIQCSVAGNPGSLGMTSIGWFAAQRWRLGLEGR
jgi:hypothetical protein